MSRWTSLAAADVGYPPQGGAIAALVMTDEPRFNTVVAEHLVQLPAVEPYQPGAFYTRALPALEAVLGVSGPVELLIIDGYVDLDPSGRPGLGTHAHAAFGIPIVGVAKSAFRSATHAVTVQRGRSMRPLHVTAAGLDLATAAELVREMAGPFRLPNALRRVDQLTRPANTPDATP
jgi:deoxyribonuclease V